MKTTIIIDTSTRDSLNYLKRKTKKKTYDKLLTFLISTYKKPVFSPETINILEKVQLENSLDSVEDTVIALVDFYENPQKYEEED